MTFGQVYILCLIILAGTPDTTQLSGTSEITTEFGAIITLFPMIILPIALAPGPK